MWLREREGEEGHCDGGREREGRKDGPRARNRSSERIAIAFTRRTETLSLSACQTSFLQLCFSAESRIEREEKGGKGGMDIL